jgi:hypothetical protein
MSFEISTESFVSASDADTFEQYFSTNDRVELLGAFVIDSAGITQHGTNYRTISIQLADGSATCLSYSTKTADQGTLTANTPGELVVSDASKLIFEAGAGYKVRSAASGAGKACSGTVVMKFQKARKY